MFAALLSVQGDARDPASGRLLYREHHVLRTAGDATTERVVLYRCPDGAAFARKRVDYRASAIAPDFSLLDARDGYREGVRRKGADVAVFEGARSTRIRHAADDAPLVADAGFDEFLRLHWDAVLASKTTPIRFAVPALARAPRFDVRSLGPAFVGPTPVQAFQLRPGGLLALVSPRIDVAYDARTHALRRYTGLTNIRDDRGRPLAATIDFAEPPRPVAAGDWDASVEAPLVACPLGR